MREGVDPIETVWVGLTEGDIVNDTEGVAVMDVDGEMDGAEEMLLDANTTGIASISGGLNTDIGGGPFPN